MCGWIEVRTKECGRVVVLYISSSSSELVFEFELELVFDFVFVVSSAGCEGFNALVVRSS